MKTALVTGTSSGLGASIAAELARREFRVVGTSRHGGAYTQLDVTDAASITRCVGALDRLDLLVNNAGVMLRGAVEETDDRAARAVFDTNFFGAAALTRAALPLLRAARGRVINMGSIACGNAPPLVGFYAASKHALLGYTEALRTEQQAFGVDVCLVEPSDFRSNLFTAPLTCDPLPEYDQLRAVLSPFFARIVERAEDPAIVARLVGDLACARSTRLRNRVGRWGERLPRIKALLPQRAFERFMQTGLGLSEVIRDAQRSKIRG